jgi:hypothetical protein
MNPSVLVLLTAVLCNSLAAASKCATPGYRARAIDASATLKRDRHAIDVAVSTWRNRA